MYEVHTHKNKAKVPLHIYVGCCRAYMYNYLTLNVWLGCTYFVVVYFSDSQFTLLALMPNEILMHATHKANKYQEE